MKRCLGVAVGALLLTACHAPLRPSMPASTPAPAPAAQAPTPGVAIEAPAAAPSVADLAAAVAADARRADRDNDSKTRASLADAAGRDADACLARAPQAAACLYSRALSLGLAARSHPAQAGELLKRMLEALSAADAADPEYDEAGPARVRALVLARSPGWPLGPGDPEAAVTAARRAVSLRPQFPPNALALGEALAKIGDARAAGDSFARARDLALALPASDDREDWLRDAQRGLLKEQAQ